MWVHILLTYLSVLALSWHKKTSATLSQRQYRNVTPPTNGNFILRRLGFFE